MKKLFLALLAAAALSSSIFISSSAQAGEDAKNAHVVVYYFHGQMRCPTCYKLEQYSKEKKVTKTGDGGIDASFKAIDECVGNKYHLTQFLIQAATGGSSALARVHVALEHKKKTYWGTASDIDTIIAASKAYIDAINKFV